MIEFGYTLSSEEHDPASLVGNARTAEERGFEFASISDHFHPWVSEQGHSPFVWSVLGAISQATSTLRVGTGVSCPIMRIDPVILAHAAATTSLLFGNRFFFGVGSGEALNEHIVGRRWPPAPVRLEMLEEAIEVIRELWSGETISHRGRHFEVENAKLFDPPDPLPPLIVSAFGPKAAELAGRVGDGYFGVAPNADSIETFEAAGGKGPRYGQIDMCWAADESAARRTIKQVWPNAGVSGQLSQDLPTWKHFESATENLTEDQVVGAIPCGPDAAPVVRAVEEYIEAGYDHLYFHQIGPDQDGFFRFWDAGLRPALEAAGLAS